MNTFEESIVIGAISVMFFILSYAYPFLGITDNGKLFFLFSIIGAVLATVLFLLGLGEQEWEAKEK